MLSVPTFAFALSMGIMRHELAAAYAAALAGSTPAWVPPTLLYHHYASWQRQRFAGGGEWRRQLAYWQKVLGAGAPAQLELQTDRPQTDVQSSAGAAVPLRLGAEAAAGLRARPPPRESPSSPPCWQRCRCFLHNHSHLKTCRC